MNNVRQTCIGVFSQVMEVHEDSITDSSNPDNVESWDSLAHVQLISALEETFSIEINPDEGIELENFKMIVSFFESKLT
ncbi:MAG TPA: acyl carrier protein [Desulfobacterales bacterium]|nr:acyl carrier protein [Desulfobacterales bacterium]